ncbi:phosphate/phosphite/phosphonate ABC transporter substrate-binding protein [Haloplasma contractile]|uniref:Periplasmic binding protein component of Pn transporter n=1 Tax=Haloplasma contractile SSD-17B TaxID=1033810 RepID=F7Q0D2_9MOLU|nr:phosphate/phosphite/phosphonate ABC transporter substrate-binding protein [Haloplasma contractile]ERJ12722.1 Periplasmic binding protein component of Pn transporter [Haloplasma contractile SSD-17B]
MKKIAIVIALLSILIISACKKSDSNLPTFKVAVIPAQTTGVVEEGYKKLEHVLADGLNRKVELIIYPNYNAVVEAINYNHVDLAFLGPTTYLIAREQSGAEAIATPLINGEPYYHSYIITHADSPWNNLDELLQEVETIDFAFGSIVSTSGSIIPSYELLQRNVFTTEENHNFKSVVYTGSHDVTALQVQNKLVDAGAIDSAIFHSLANSGDIDESEFTIIWQSEQLYQYPWVVPAGTDRELINDIQSVFLEITDPEILEVFGGASGFVVADSDKYQNVLQAINAVRPEMLKPKE